MVCGRRCSTSPCSRLPTALSTSSRNLSRYLRSRSRSLRVRGDLGKAFCSLRMNCSASSEVTSRRRDFLLMSILFTSRKREDEAEREQCLRVAHQHHVLCQWTAG